jgi:hypothetical protein
VGLKFNGSILIRYVKRYSETKRRGAMKMEEKTMETLPQAKEHEATAGNH